MYTIAESRRRRTVVGTGWTRLSQLVQVTRVARHPPSFLFSVWLASGRLDRALTCKSENWNFFVTTSPLGDLENSPSVTRCVWAFILLSAIRWLSLSLYTRLASSVTFFGPSSFSPARDFNLKECQIDQIEIARLHRPCPSVVFTLNSNVGSGGGGRCGQPNRRKNRRRRRR